MGTAIAGISRDDSGLEEWRLIEEILDDRTYAELSDEADGENVESDDNDQADEIKVSAFDGEEIDAKPDKLEDVQNEGILSSPRSVINQSGSYAETSRTR